MIEQGISVEKYHSNFVLLSFLKWRKLILLIYINVTNVIFPTFCNFLSKEYIEDIKNWF